MNTTALVHISQSYMTCGYIWGEYIARPQEAIIDESVTKEM